MDSIITVTTDPLQFGYRENRLVDDAVALAFNSALEHLDNPSTYAHILFLDYSSAFNNVHPAKLIAKLADLELPTPTCNCI